MDLPTYLLPLCKDLLSDIMSMFCLFIMFVTDHAHCDCYGSLLILWAESFEFQVQIVISLSKIRDRDYNIQFNYLGM